MNDNKELTYPELMQKASKEGGPDKLLKNEENKGLAKGVVLGLAITGSLLAVISLLSD